MIIRGFSSLQFCKTSDGSRDHQMLLIITTLYQHQVFFYYLQGALTTGLEGSILVTM